MSKGMYRESIMKKGVPLFLIGLFMYMFGIYLSTHWVVLGSLIVVGGGLVMGSSIYFLSIKGDDNGRK